MMQSLTNGEKTRKLRWALTGDAFNFSYVYMTVAGPIFLLFLDRIGLSKTQIGVLLGMIMFMSIIAVFVGPMTARAGIKRMFLATWTLRKFIYLGMIAVPWVAVKYGADGAFIAAAILLFLFSICRAVGESARAAWSQEFVPASIRGKFTAVQMGVIMLACAATVFVAGRFLGKDPDPSRFQWIFVVAFLFGLICVVCYSRVPGGAPIHNGMPGGTLADAIKPFGD